MFLRKLSKEKGEMFLQLSVHAALTNNDLTIEEKEIISEYCEELGIKDYKIEIKTDLDRLLNEIKESSTEEEKNIIVFEIVALIMADREYDDKEHEFIKSVKDKLDISDDKLNTMFELIKELMNVYEGISKVIKQ
ncbi:hypothetical protein ACUH7Y_25830 [Clostridium beijerinckii]|jgi:Tellurite resistance protein TerB.|uniref:Co-chaperone DjlA N-terminal domain-containing protein n=1 Tax=Clostridium beijerinckii TaxID=1520 RepID=A0A7X9XS59_CLOBE|nr:hypothetical protein [Clostridium beijerinckii]NMF07955.1 hypothetical protein [Clostridium beijerinckii]